MDTTKRNRTLHHAVGTLARVGSLLAATADVSRKRLPPDIAADLRRQGEELMDEARALMRAWDISGDDVQAMVEDGSLYPDDTPANEEA